MLLEQESRDIRHRRLAVLAEDDTIDDREVDVRIIPRDDLHDGRLG